MLAFLMKVPVLSSVIEFVTGKSRLAIEYAIVAVLVAVAGFTASMWMEKTKAQAEMVELKLKVATLESVTEGQGDTIATLMELRTRDAQALDGLLHDYQLLAENDSLARRRLAMLEQNNETVRRYLASPVPAELECLLNYTCAAGSAHASGSTAAAPVRSSLVPAVPAQGKAH